MADDTPFLRGLGLYGTAAEASTDDPQQRRVAWKLAEENSDELYFTWTDFSKVSNICLPRERGRRNRSEVDSPMALWGKRRAAPEKPGRGRGRAGDRGPSRE